LIIKNISDKAQRKINSRILYISQKIIELTDEYKYSSGIKQSKDTIEMKYCFGGADERNYLGDEPAIFTVWKKQKLFKFSTPFLRVSLKYFYPKMKPRPPSLKYQKSGIILTQCKRYYLKICWSSDV